MTQSDRQRQQAHRKKRKEQGDKFVHLRLPSALLGQIRRVAEVLDVDLHERGAHALMIGALLSRGASAFLSENEGEQADAEALEEIAEEAVRVFADQVLLRLYLRRDSNSHHLNLFREAQRSVFEEIYPGGEPLRAPLMYF